MKETQEVKTVLTSCHRGDQIKVTFAPNTPRDIGMSFNRTHGGMFQIEANDWRRIDRIFPSAEPFTAVITLRRENEGVDWFSTKFAPYLEEFAKVA